MVKMKANSAALGMESIGITTLIVSSTDDPIVGPSSQFGRSRPKNKNLILMNTKRGGHVAWYDGILPVGPMWGERAACSFFSSLLEIHAHTQFIINVVLRSTSQGNIHDFKNISRIVSSSDFDNFKTNS